MLLSEPILPLQLHAGAFATPMNRVNWDVPYRIARIEIVEFIVTVQGGTMPSSPPILSSVAPI